jgi:signal transduction histidine kinase
MSQRVTRQLDMVAAYGRWLALLGVLVVALVSLPLRGDSPAGTVLLITLGMAILDAAPVIMLHFKFYPDYAALAFSAVDSVFSLVMLYLSGSGMFFYCFVPVLTMSTRFDWVIGLADAGLLAIGNILIALIREQFSDVGRVLPAALFQAFGLLAASLLTGFLADGLRKEPPLGNEEVKALNEKIKTLQSAADRSRAIYEMASMLGATLSPDKILDAVLEISTVGFDELVSDPTQVRERPASAVFLFGPEGMYIATSRNIGYEETGVMVSGDCGVLYDVLRRDEPMLLGNLADDADLRQFSPFRRCRSAICVPLRAGFELYGAVLFASPVPGAFTEEHLELLSAVSNQAAVALNTAQLYQDIEEEKDKILEVTEEERNKLARDLHDGPTQSISAIAMRLNFARLLLDREPQKVKEELFKLENLARRTTKEIRTMLFALRPVVLETQGLKVAVEQFVEKLQETGELPVTLEIQDVEDEIDVSTKAVAWFIVGEALNNAKKYADAENIWVRIYMRDEHFVAEVEDNGSGFDYEAKMATYDQSGSFGLRNYKERADLVNGKTIVRSAPGRGTKVTLVVPLRQDVI